MEQFFLIYLAYKISFSNASSNSVSENPVKFIETFFFQFLNPKGVIVAIIIVSTYVESGIDFINYSLWVIGVAFFFCMCKYYFLDITWKIFEKICDK